MVMSGAAKVRSIELDLSLYVPALATSVVGMVLSGNKGTKNSPTLITDEGTLVNTFGAPEVSDYGLLAAIRYLRKGNQLWVVRVGSYDVVASKSLMSGASAAVLVDALSTGSWGNELSIVVTTGSVQGYQLQVRESGVVRETYDNVLLGLANVADPDYISTRINGVSEYVVVTPDTAYSTLTPATYTLSGGVSGTADSADIVGTQVGNTATGLQLFRNPDVYDIDLLATPGIWWKDVVAEILSIAEGRGDAFGLIDPPLGLSVQEVVEWHNGLLTGDPEYLTTQPNSSYAGLLYPWVQVYDSYSGSDLFVPPSGHWAGQMAYSDFLADPWFAPAGMTRGVLVDALDIEYSAKDGERDYMYGTGLNAVNPIVNFKSRGGIVIWGQKTLLRNTTALNRINVRRMLNYLKKIISQAVRALLFEPNDSGTWGSFTRLVNPVLRDVKARRGLYDFKVICDATTNTPAVIDRSTMIAKILLQPTKAAELIELQFTLLPTGANFSEFVTTP